MVNQERIVNGCKVVPGFYLNEDSPFSFHYHIILDDKNHTIITYNQIYAEILILIIQAENENAVHHLISTIKELMKNSYLGINCATYYQPKKILDEELTRILEEEFFEDISEDPMQVEYVYERSNEDELDDVENKDNLQKNI